MTQLLSLAGAWRVCLGGTPVGDTPPPERAFAGEILLPATTETAALSSSSGSQPSTLSSQLPPPVSPLSPPDHRTDRLTAVRRIEGPVWYQREIEIPAAWSGHEISLFIERTKWCRVFLDGLLLGDDPILCAPHHTPLGQLTPGRHQLTLCVDNSRKPAPGDNHQTSEHTQGNWNGLLGRLELRATTATRIEHVEIVSNLGGTRPPDAFSSSRIEPTRPEAGFHPSSTGPSFRLIVHLSTEDSAPLNGTLSLQAESYNHADNPHQTAAVSLTLSGSRGIIEATLPLGAEAKLWDEFSPALYRITITLNTAHGTDVRVITTGLREFHTRGTQFTINGRTTFLRGEVNCCVFPLTGHPPMDVAGWHRYYRTLQEYGINHVRFHSWTPPDAAFTAADELGLYIQTELPFWGEWNDDIRRAFLPEGEAILRTFGHHPSFVLLSLGNEHRGDRSARAGLVAHLRQLDPHRLYIEGANNDLETPLLAPADDCWITVRVPDPAHPGRYANVRGGFATNDGANGHLQIGPGGTRADYSAAIAGLRVPVISHEIGQFTVSPHFAEIARYTGVFAAHNLEHFRAKAAAAGLLAEADDAFLASGKLAALLYREEIEAALRTPGFGGFQLLGLQDFPGQGTALVGLLNALMESKGAITPAEFRKFCAPHVLLARFDRHTWTAGEIFSTELELAQYGPMDLPAGSIEWQVSEPRENSPLAGGRLITSSAAQGGLRHLGSLQFTLPNVATAKRVDLILKLDATGGPASPRAADGSKPIEISYPLWIFPAFSLGGLASPRAADGGDAAPPTIQIASELDPTPPSSVKLVRHFDAATQSALASGGNLVLIPDAAHPLAHSPGGGFMTDFWCWPLFYNKPGTMGLLVRPEHPALAGFPTATHSDWQWYHLAQAAQPVVLDSLPATLRPIVRVLDNLDRVHRLGLIFETRAGTGRLLVCAVDLPALAWKHPEARQLLASLLAYAGSTQFAPTESLDLAVLSRTLEAKLPLFDAKLSASTARPNRDPFLVLNAKPNNAIGGTRPPDGFSSTHALQARPEAALHPISIVGEWWQTDFPAPVDFDAVELVWDKEQARYRAAVEITDDGLSWHLLSKVNSGETPLRYHRINAAARGVRAVRVRVNGLSADSVIGLNELRLIRPQ